MGKFKSKLKSHSKAKGKRWPKGQSSISNPEAHKFRDQAKSRFFQENLGPSSLTSNAVQKHNALQTYTSPLQTPTTMETEEDAFSQYTSESSYKTMQTFATDWTDCSNMSFKRFLNVFRADSALHKEMLAILAAIAEVIKQNGGTESPTEYYCALVTTLEQIMLCDVKNEDQITATISLLNIGIKTVPVPVLNKTFDSVTKEVLNILAEFSKSDNNVIVRSALGVLGVLLKNQELAIWNLSQTQQIFNAVLNPFCIHTKPKWRKGAQAAALAVIRSEVFTNEKNYNPAADRVAEFCQHTLDACLGTNSNSTVLVSSVQSGQTTILHTLGLLKDTIRYFNKNYLKSICETILRLMSLNYPIVTSCSLQVLHSLFSSQIVVGSARLNGQIIAALYDYQPSAQDVQPTTAWLAVMQQAHVHLADSDIGMSAAALPRIFSSISQLWLTQKDKIFTAATRAIEMLLKDALAPLCATSDLVQQYQSKISNCIQTLETCLGYQFNHAWHQILHTIAVLFEVGGQHCKQMLTGLLKILSELRDSYKFTYNNELEFAVGAAIKSMGAETVLSIISLQKDNGDFNLDRSWLILVLKENIQNSSLEFWVKNILPFSLHCQRRFVQLQAVNDGIGAHSAELLHFQLWNLLPSFCNSPTDISTSFKSIAKTLGMAISDNKDLRLTAMSAIRKLIQSAKESNNSADIAEISRFDKNFLPILFNLYTTKAVGTDEEGQRLASLETIKVFLTIAKPELTKELFENALGRLSKVDLEENFTKESILDLLRTLLSYQDKDSIEQLYNMCIKKLPEIKNRTEQKKTYRLLEEICRSESEGCTSYLKVNRKFVQKLLRKSLNSAAVSSKGARLRCLCFLIKAQPQLDHDSLLIKSAIPEAILCCRDLNTRCRETAFELINIIGETLEKHNETKEFLTMIIAGLAGNPQMISMTIIALSSILHNFSGSLGQENSKIILENILLLIKTPTREITSSCLGFIKIFVSALPRPTVAPFLPLMITSLSEMTDDCKRHFRIKIRHLLDKLMRKFTSEAVTPLVPSNDTVMFKQIRNLRKLHNRLKRRNEVQDNDDDDDEHDMDDDFLVKARPKTMEEILADSDSELEEEVVKDKPKKSKKQFNAFIDEDPDTIVDFNDPSASSRIMASKPKGHIDNTQDKPKKSDNRGFKTAPDGRLIIADDSDSDDDNDKNKKNKKFDIGLDSDSGDDAETEILRDRKRKRSDASSMASSVKSNILYKPGGSGIHRKVAASSSSVKSFGSDYKGKKAFGDVKKKGKHDPYAYVPLQRSTLNKRKKNKVAGQFKNIVGAAKSGAKKGMKAKRSRKS